MAAELSWEAFQEFFLAPGKPKAIRLNGSVPATLFVAEEGRSIGLRLPVTPGAAKLRSPLSQLRIAVTGKGKSASLELSTGARQLYKEFFLFALGVADRAQQKGVDVADAVDAALRSWRELLQRAARLSREAELGLIGELLTLQRLLDASGDVAIEAWTGPLRQRHDFRLDGLELEVKTTATGEREHFINGWEQLKPSKGMALHLLSIQLESAGSAKGFSLPELATSLAKKLGPGAVSGLRVRLEKSGYVEADASQYPDRFKRRNPDRLIRVDDAFPRIVPELLKLADGLKHRITELHYRVNVGDLGVDDSDPLFAKTLGIGKK